ncbi:MAG TPA: hypothetical protein VEW46_12065 [Pyrinomonadaceae bacterium]|nr:hypothetical protein [Pyrinomonadaceae bacterium]
MKHSEDFEPQTRAGKKESRRRPNNNGLDWPNLLAPETQPSLDDAPATHNLNSARYA